MRWTRWKPKHRKVRNISNFLTKFQSGTSRIWNPDDRMAHKLCATLCQGGLRRESSSIGEWPYPFPSLGYQKHIQQTLLNLKFHHQFFPIISPHNGLGRIDVLGQLCVRSHCIFNKILKFENSKILKSIAPAAVALHGVASVRRRVFMASFANGLDYRKWFRLLKKAALLKQPP